MSEVSSMQRFLHRIKDLVWPLLSQEDKDHFSAIARGHAGGLARAEKLRADAEAKEEAEAKQFPYPTLVDLPENVRGALPEAAQKVWLAAFNSANKQHPDDEAACARIAWGAVKSAGYHPADGGWKKGGENDIAIESIVASVEASHMGTYRLLGEVSLAEGGKSIEVQIFPRVGTYQHPRYGELKITPEFLEEVKRNFDAHVYQQELPLTIDLEHQSSLSGAVGWVSKVDVRGSDGAFATIDLNDRGQELVGSDRYRYFSPEYYDKWVDPASGKEHANLLIGGALTNRPFFKGMRPVAVMTEGILAFAEPAGEVEAEEESREMAAVLKTDGGEQYPAAAYLYVPDPESPSTWKVRIWESPSAKVTKAQLGAAAAAFSPGGFRGQPVQMPATDRARCIARLRSLYAGLGVKPDEMPAHVAGIESDPAEQEHEPVGMTEEEAKRLTELETAHRTLTERLAAEETARKAAEAQAQAASERAARLERDANRRTLTEEVRAHRLGYRGEVDAAVARLESLQAKLSTEEFQGILDDNRAIHAQMSESEAFKQVSRPGGESGPALDFDSQVRKIMSERSLSHPDAIMAVARENPGLYARIDAAHNRLGKRGAD